MASQMKSAGKRSLEQLLVLEGVVQLRPRHRARVEPGVDHRGDAAHRAVAAVSLTGEFDLVDVGAVEVLGDLGALLAQLGDRAGAEVLVAVLRVALPDRQRGAPVAVA